MQKMKSFINYQKYVQGINRKFLLLLLAFVFIFTAAFFSAAAAGQERLSVKVGAYANHPKIYMDDNGRVSGFWPDLMEDIAETENWEIEYVWGTWSDGLDHLINKEIDIMPDVAFTEKRNKLYAFSEAPVLMSWTRMYANKENEEIQSITDLKNKKIAALKGSVNLEGAGGLREIAHGFNLNCTFLELDNYTEVFRAVEEGKADAGITNRNFGNKNAKNFKVKKTPILFQPVNMKFAFPKYAKSTPYFPARINYHIKQLKQDERSIYYRLLEKYFEAEIAEKRVEVFPLWLGRASKIIATLLFVFILVIIVSRIQVKRKTRELKVGKELLQVNEERYRSVFENTGTATLILEEDKTISMVNSEFEKLSCYSREEIEGKKKWIEFVASEDLETMKEYHAGRRENGDESPTEYTFRFADRHGSIRDIFIRVNIIPGTKRSIASLMDITPLKRSEESLRQSEEKYRNFFVASKDAVLITSVDGKVLDINDYGLKLFGSKSEDLDKMDIAGDMYADPEDRATFMKIIGRVGYVTSHAVNFKRMDGTVFPASITAVQTHDSKSNVTGYQGIIRDETERKNAEDNIKRSLREKEALLAEIHHRVKNNMQIISSLLSLQSRDIEDERALSLIKNCEDRIRSMSLIHEKLYLSEDLSRIDFHDYMKDLSARLFQVHRVDSRVVRFSSQIKDVLFNIETAIPLGLIINELISNALKHAFPEGGKGNIAVKLTRNKKTEEYTLTVADDGIGFSEETDYKNTETFGLRLVNLLADQLGGTMELDRSKGTSFKIIFKEQAYRKRI